MWTMSIDDVQFRNQHGLPLGGGEAEPCRPVAHLN
jgi:hypothetical protein